jgi:hypothetical protein
MGFDDSKISTKGKSGVEIVSRLIVGGKQIHKALKDVKSKKLSKEEIEDIRIDSYSYTY